MVCAGTRGTLAEAAGAGAGEKARSGASLYLRTHLRRISFSRRTHNNVKRIMVIILKELALGAAT